MFYGQANAVRYHFKMLLFSRELLIHRENNGDSTVGESSTPEATLEGSSARFQWSGWRHT